MNKEKIKELSKRIVRQRFLSPDEVKTHARAYLKQDHEVPFLEYLTDRDLLTCDQVTQLRSGESGASASTSQDGTSTQSSSDARDPEAKTSETPDPTPQPAGQNASTGGTPSADVSTPDANQSSANELNVTKRIQRPTPVPELPENADSFDPPAVTVNEGRGVSKWTLTAGPGETLAIGEYGFTPDTTFTLYASSEDGTTTTEITPKSVEEFTAMLTLPEDVPDNSVYFLYPTTGEGRGYPAILNRPEVWYSLPRNPHSGQEAHVYGRNLSHNLGETKSWVYPKKKGEKGVVQKAAVLVYTRSPPAGNRPRWLQGGEPRPLGSGPHHVERVNLL